MALYETNILAISSNPEVHTDLRDKIPAKLDARVWADDYRIVSGIYLDSGIPYTYVSVRFNASADRTTILNQINALTEFKTDCEIGSYIKKHKCFHDEGGDCNPPVVIWRKS